MQLGSYRAQLMIPGEDTCPREREELMKLWRCMLEAKKEEDDDLLVDELKEAEDWKKNQALLTNLKDWHFRQVTSSANVIRRVYSGLLEMKDELDPGEDEETRATIEDLELEEAGEFPLARHSQNPLNRVMLYPFTLSVQQIEILLHMAEVVDDCPPSQGSEPATILRDVLEGMIQRMDERYQVPFPYWLFPSLFMQEPLLMEWASTIFPLSYLVKAVDMVSHRDKNHIPASALLTLMMGVPPRGGGRHLRKLKREHGWDDEKIKKVEALRRGLSDLHMVDEESIHQVAPLSHAANIAPSYGIRALHNGLVGSHYQVGFDNDYYWLSAAALSSRMQVEILRRAMDKLKLSLLGVVVDLDNMELPPLLSNDTDREEGRYGGGKRKQAQVIQTRTTIANIVIHRSMDMINLLIAPDANMGPLDWVVHQLGGEFISIGTPQPTDSTTWRGII